MISKLIKKQRRNVIMSYKSYVKLLIADRESRRGEALDFNQVMDEIDVLIQKNY